MSIIADAIKKVEKEKVRDENAAGSRYYTKDTVDSRDYLQRMLGPERKEVYKREEAESEILTAAAETPKSTGKKIMVGSGLFLTLVILFLTIVNMYFASSPEVKMALPTGSNDLAAVPLEAETYTDTTSEVKFIEDKATSAAKRSRSHASLAQGGISTNFRLNGIVYASDDSWAIINNKVVRVGDVLDGAKVVSISPQNVVLLVEGEKVALAVK